jgi:hypothetical protein
MKKLRLLSSIYLIALGIFWQTSMAQEPDTTVEQFTLDRIKKIEGILDVTMVELTVFQRELDALQNGTLSKDFNDVLSKLNVVSTELAELQKSLPLESLSGENMARNTATIAYLRYCITALEVASLENADASYPRVSSCSELDVEITKPDFILLDFISVGEDAYSYKIATMSSVGGTYVWDSNIGQIERIR